MIARALQPEEQLEQLLDRVENRAGALSFDETRELAQLYRVCSAHLVQRQARGRDPEAVRFLNALCVRAFTRLQVPSIHRQRVPDFFFADLPKVLAATAWLQALTAILMLAGAIAGASLAAHNPATVYECIPSAMYPPGKLDTLIESKEARSDFLERKPTAFGWKSEFSAALFTHNLGTGLLSFAVGILAGIPTLVLIFYNGLTIGTFAWIFSRDAMWPMFWAWLLPHAIPELLAITLCSTAGLMLGRAVVAPGRQGVGAALLAAGPPALELVAASVPLLIVAAFIESFVRQSTLSSPVRFVTAAIALGLIVAYVRYVRQLARRPAAPDLSWLFR